MKFIFFLFLFSCSNFVYTEKDLSLNNEDQILDYSDVTGKYIQKRIVRVKNRKVFTSTRLYNESSYPNKVLEKTVTVSQIGTLAIGKRRSPLLRPYASQYTIWFEGKKYFTQLKVNTTKKSMDVYLKSPEKKWNGTKRVKFPKGHVFCFYTQLPECVKTTAFVKKAIESRTGQMPFTLIWDNYPYYGEYFSNVNEELFSSANIIYDGIVDDGYRFRVEVGQQVLFYHFNKNLQFQKMLWVSQGLSSVKRDKSGETNVGK